MPDRDLYTVTVMFRDSQHKYVFGWKRYIDAQQAFERLTIARKTHLADPDVAFLSSPVNGAQEPPQAVGRIFRISDDYRQVLDVDVADVMAVSLTDVERAHDFGAELHHLALRGQLHTNQLVQMDHELRLAMGKGSIMPPNANQ